MPEQTGLAVRQTGKCTHLTIVVLRTGEDSYFSIVKLTLQANSRSGTVLKFKGQVLPQTSTNIHI